MEFSKNGSHGLSAGNLNIEDSTVTANNNGYNGIIFTGKGTIKDSTVTITGTKGKSYWNAGMRLFKSNATMDIVNSTVTIKDNEVSGIFCDSGSKLTIDDSSNVTVTGNNAAQENCSTKKDLAQSGGGLWCAMAQRPSWAPRPPSTTTTLPWPVMISLWKRAAS